MAREAIATGQAPRLAQAAERVGEFNARTIYELAAQGDEPAQRIFQRFGRALGILLADLVNVLNLEMYVIGGGVVSAWDFFAPAMFQEMCERSIVYAATAPPEIAARGVGAAANIVTRTRRATIVTKALLGSDAGLFGAARLPVR
jgi:glucokinase